MPKSHRTRVATATRRAVAAAVESLEGRRLLAVLAPDHVVIVIEQDRFSNAVGNPIMPYVNALAQSGLTFTNSHGVTHPSTPNTLALFSGWTQWVDDNSRTESFDADNLALSLFNVGKTFAGFTESLPADGSQVTQAGTAAFPDLYTRNLNAMAQFTDYGIDPKTGLPRPNAAVNKTFGAFSSIPPTDYSSLPTVSFIVPNNLNSTHGSNEAYPYAGSADEENNDILRKSADNWLKNNIDNYLKWAKANNSLLIVTQDEERWTGGTAATTTTIVNGDPDLFTPGTNSANVNHYNVLRTIEDMYGLQILGETRNATPLKTDAAGKLVGDVVTPPPATPVATTTTIAKSATTTVSGQPLTLTATVKATAGTATGVVTFKDGTTVLGTATLNASGLATFTTGALAVGSHSLTASYAGAAPFVASNSGAISHAVAKATTSVAVASSLPTSTSGQAVKFTASVAVAAPGAGVAAGAVQFQVDGVNVGSAVAVVNGIATSAAFATLSVGSHTVRAIYAGSTALLGSTSATIAQTVNAAGAPANDRFAGRKVLSGNSINATGTNVGATKEAGEPSHAGKTGGKSIWASWTATSTTRVTVDTIGSTFDTLLAVYTGTSVGSLSRVDSDNDSGTGKTSKLSFICVSGRTYQIAVDGLNGASGSVVLRIRAGFGSSTPVTVPMSPPAAPTTLAAKSSLWSALAIA